MTDEVATALERVPNWEGQFTMFLWEMQKLSNEGQLQFDWENVNCGWFAAKAIREVTEVDLYGPFEEVTSQFSAAKVLVGLGCKSLEEYVDKMLPERPLIMAQKGDVCLVEGILNEGPALAVVDPPFFWATAEEGLVKGELWSNTSNVRVIKAYAVG